MADRSRWGEGAAEHDYGRYADEGYRGRDESGRPYGAPTHDLRTRYGAYEAPPPDAGAPREASSFEPSRGYDATPYGYGAGYGREGSRVGQRDWWDRTRDELAARFGSREAERRREWDRIRGPHRGRGPRGYRRADERIWGDVNDRLTDDPWLDAADMEVSVRDGEVTLSGQVSSRLDKRRAEDLAEAVPGVTDVQNNLRIRPPQPSTGAAAAAPT